MAKGDKRASRFTFRVVVSAAERARIEGHARQLGMPVSAYLRALGLGYQPLGQTDLEAVASLTSAMADQARLGNLLRMWLADDVKLAAFDRQKAAAVIGEVSELIRDNQTTLKRIVSRINRTASPARSRLAGDDLPA